MGKHDPKTDGPDPAMDGQGPGPIPPASDPGKHAKDDEKKDD